MGRGANECRAWRQCEEEGEGGQVLPAGRATGAAAALAEAAVCHTHMKVVNSGHSGGGASSASGKGTEAAGRENARQKNGTRSGGETGGSRVGCTSVSWARV